MACWRLWSSQNWDPWRAMSGWRHLVPASRLGALSEQQVWSLARAAGLEPCQSSRLGACQSSRLGALPGQQVRSLARAAGWEPCQGSRLGALPGQQVRNLARAAVGDALPGWAGCTPSQGGQVMALPRRQAAGACLGLERAAWKANATGVWNAWCCNRYRSTAWDVC